MTLSIPAVFNSLLHSRKFHAYLVGILFAILVPVVNKYAGLQLDPTVLTGLVVSSVGGAGLYGLATAVEDGNKAKATAQVQVAAIQSRNDTGEEMAAVSVQGLGGFGSIGGMLGGVGKDIGIQLLVSQLLGRIKGEKNQARAEDIAADVLKQILAQFGNSESFRRKAGI